jgi:hypothetical protein
MDPCTEECEYVGFMTRFLIEDVDPALIKEDLLWVDDGPTSEIQIKARNEKYFPMVYQHFHVEAEFVKIEDFDVYSDEKVSVNVMTSRQDTNDDKSEDNVQTYAMNTGANFPTLGAKCQGNLDPIADIVMCHGLSTFCYESTDTVTINIMKGGNSVTKKLSC